MRLVVAVALACSTSACVPNSLEQLEATGSTLQISSPLPWQDAYRRLNDRMRQCVDFGGLVTGGVDSQLYDGFGEIIVRYQSGPLTSKAGPLMQVQVRPSGEGSAVRVTHGNHMLAQALAPRVDMWLAGATDCRP